MLGWSKTSAVCKYWGDKPIDEGNRLPVNILQAKCSSFIYNQYSASVAVCGISEDKVLTCIYKTVVKAVQPALKYRYVAVYR